jgi:hypothetical protein
MLSLGVDDGEVYLGLGGGDTQEDIKGSWETKGRFQIENFKFEMRQGRIPPAAWFAVDFVQAHALCRDVEMSEVQAAVCQPQPVAFLLELYFARASREQERDGCCAVPRVRKTGQALRAGARGAGEDADRVSGADEFCGCKFAEREHGGARGAGAAIEPSAIHKNRIAIASQSRAFVPV